MKIVCSRQTFIEQTDRQTKISISWAPCRSQKLLEIQVVDLTEACIQKKKEVNVKKRQIKYIGLKKSTNLTRKTEVQDRLDRILKIAYPFVSERKGWTDAGTRITIEDEIDGQYPSQSTLCPSWRG